MAIWFLSTALALGAALAVELRVKLHPAEIAALAVTLGLLIATWLLWLCVLCAGYRAGVWLGLAAQSVIAAGLLGRRVVRARRQGPPHADATESGPPRPGAAWWIMTAASIAVFWPLFSSHMLRASAGGWYSGGWTAVDFLHHMAFAARFAAQSSFTFDSPLAAGERLTYPFLIDFLSGGLMRMGLSARMSFLLPALLLTLAGVQLLFFFALRLFARARAAWSAVALFFLGGSAAGLLYFWRDWQASGAGLPHFLMNMRKQYAQLGDKGIALGNFVCNEVLPQRGVPLGLAVFLAVALLALLARDRAGRHRFWLLAAAGALTGLLPFSHVHTFMVCVALLGWFALAETVEKRSLANPAVAALAIALLVALPQLGWQLGGLGRGFVRLHLGWLMKPHENVVGFWLRNLGLTAVFLLGNVWIVWRLRDAFHWRFYVPLLLLFLICNLVALQPAVYDNSKILYYCYLGAALYAGYGLAVLSQRGWPGMAAAALLLLAMTVVGGLSILRESYARGIVYRSSDLDLAEKLDRAVPPDARILADEANPVPPLAGRAMALALRQTLANHGARIGPLERDLRRMFAAEPAALPLFCRHRVTHAWFGPVEKRKWRPKAVPPWMRRIEIDAAGIDLYEIDPRACAATVSAPAATTATP